MSLDLQTRVIHLLPTLVDSLDLLASAYGNRISHGRLTDANIEDLRKLLATAENSLREMKEGHDLSEFPSLLAAERKRLDACRERFEYMLSISGRS